MSSPRSSAFVVDLFQFVDGFFERLMLIVLQESRRNRIRKPERPHRAGGDRALRAFLIHHNANNLDIVGRIKLFQHFFRVGHLRHSFRRDERNRINMLESRADQGFQIVGLDVSGDLPLQPLPGIARTFDEFYQIRH